MKANNGSGNNPSRDDWETPDELFLPLMKQYKFTFDCCASEKNTKCKDFSPNFEYCSLSVSRTGWMNPPFSKAKEMFTHFFDNVYRGVAIYRCDNLETEIWQTIIFPNASWIFIPHKRVAYKGLAGGGARFPSALIGVNVECPKFVKGIALKRDMGD